MTAPGVMTNGTPAGALLNGLSFQGMSEKVNAKGSFEKIMETAQGTKTQDTKSQTAEKKENVSEKFNEQAGNVKEKVKSMFSGKSKVKGKENAAQASETGMNQDAVMDEAANEAVSTLVVQVRQIICEVLDISEEELSGTMEALGMKDSDLFDRNSLQELFLAVNEAEDSTEFLTNEALFDDFAGMMQAVEQAVREKDLTPETVHEVLKKAELLPEKEVTEEAEVIIPKAVSENEEKTKSDEEEAVDVSQADAGDVPEAKTTQTEVKAETKESGSKSHMATAKGTEDRKEVSTETDGSLKSNFIDAMTTNLNPELGSEEALEATRQLREIANQVLEQIKVVIRPEQTNMELQLNPEHLGRVHLTITEKEGMMTAQFTTQTQVAKEAIESQMEILKESLTNQGVKVEAIEVTVSEFGFERDRDANQSNNTEEHGRRRRDNGLGSVAEAEEDMPKMEDYINATDSSIDYSA